MPCSQPHPPFLCLYVFLRFDAAFDRTFYEGALGVVWEGTAHTLSPSSSTATLVAEWTAMSAVDISRVCTELGTLLAIRPCL